MFIDKAAKEDFLKPLQIVNGIIERKQTLPILSNVLIEKEKNFIKFTSTDLEIQITTVIDTIKPDAEIQAVTVGGKKIQDILRILPEQSNISIETKENKAIIKCNKSKFSLQTLPAIDFPKLSEELINAKKITLSQAQLKSLFESVQYSMAHQDVRYYLNGVLIVIEKNKLKVVATDGHRLSYDESLLDNTYEKIETILPRKAVLELCKLLNNTEEKIELQFTAQQFKASFSDIVLVAKVIEGKFPDYERVIPKYNDKLNMDRSTIQQALQRASILSNEKFRGVRFVLTEKNLKIISSNSEQEEAQEEIETEYHGEALDIGFNINYLLDGINNINCDQVFMSFGDPNSSILITNPNNAEFRYVVMPMRI